LKAALLVGGLGTRLRPVVSDRPKSLALVDGKPFLVRLLHRLRGFGVSDIVLCAGYRWEEIRAALGDGTSLGVRLTYSVEDAPLGTAGALRHALPHLHQTFLALNGDSIVNIDLRQLTRFHLDRKAAATLALTTVDDASPYGLVEADAGGRITSFLEKKAGRTGGGWVNAGVYVLEPSVLEPIEEGRAVSLEQEALPSLLNAGSVVCGYRVQSPLLDIGTPEGYLRSQDGLRGIWE